MKIFKIGVVVPDLIKVQIDNHQTIIDILKEGNKRRTMAATASNVFSSRSHAIIIVTLKKK